MTEVTEDIYDVKTIAEVITSYPMGKFRRWLLTKLIPDSLYTAPAQKVAKLHKGSTIGKVTIEYKCSEDGDGDINIGYV